jgi:hypothetical protein
MTLRERQSRFAAMVPGLIKHAINLGYEITLGDAYRDHRVHGVPGEKKSYSAANSHHKLRLAIDINLFKDGAYLETTEDHRQLGEWWEAQGGTWGGRFKQPDGNHYQYKAND